MKLEKTKFYFDSDANLKIIQNKKVGIIGYGNQGRAQALNLSDNGVNVKIGLRKNSKTNKLVKQDNLEYDNIINVVKWADIISLLIPDQIMEKIYSDFIHPYLSIGKMILFSHGYNIHYKNIIPSENVDVVMVAPSGAGELVRNFFLLGDGTLWIRI